MAHRFLYMEEKKNLHIFLCNHISQNTNYFKLLFVSETEVKSNLYNLLLTVKSLCFIFWKCVESFLQYKSTAGLDNTLLPAGLQSASIPE